MRRRVSLPDPCDRGAAGPCGSSAQQTTGQSDLFAISYMVSVFFFISQRDSDPTASTILEGSRNQQETRFV